jgi:hypothetical protein
MITCSEPRKCSRCGTYLGEMITTELGGATVTILKAGGMNIYDLGSAECSKCGAPVYHSVSMHKLLKLLKLTGREVTIEDLMNEAATGG